MKKILFSLFLVINCFALPTPQIDSLKAEINKVQISNEKLTLQLNDFKESSYRMHLDVRDFGIASFHNYSAELVGALLVFSALLTVIGFFVVNKNKSELKSIRNDLTNQFGSKFQFLTDKFNKGYIETMEQLSRAEESVKSRMVKDYDDRFLELKNFLEAEKEKQSKYFNERAIITTQGALSQTYFDSGIFKNSIFAKLKCGHAIIRLANLYNMDIYDFDIKSIIEVIDHILKCIHGLTTIDGQTVFLIGNFLSAVPWRDGTHGFYQKQINDAVVGKIVD